MRGFKPNPSPSHLSMLATALLVATLSAPSLALAQSEPPPEGQGGAAEAAPGVPQAQPPAEDPGPPPAVPTPETAGSVPEADRAPEPAKLGDGAAPAGATPGRRVLTSDEREMLETGPISEASWVMGGIVGTWLGFGLGHAVQGRYADHGLIFTGGELLTITVGIAALLEGMFDNTVCVPGVGCSAGESNRELWIAVGFGSFLGFGILRIVEAVDVWTGPARWNKRHRQLWREFGEAKASGAAPSLSLSILPTPNGASFGATLRF